jgi:tetratricopeptide (TPR) repeat protein
MGQGKKRGFAAIALGLAVAMAQPGVSATSSISRNLGGMAATGDTAYLSAIDALSGGDHASALAYLTESITAYPDNGEAYLARARVDLLLDVPSQAVTDATQALALLRASDTCDELLAKESPILAVGGYSSYSLYPPGSYGSGLGSILNGSSLSGATSLSQLASSSSISSGLTTSSGTSTSTGTSTSSGSSTSSGTSTVGTATGSGPVATGSTSGTSGTTTSTTSSSVSTSSSLFASSSGSKNLPVAEDLTEKDKEKNETLNEYNETMVQVALYSSYCAGIYANNKDKLVEGYTLLGDAYLAQANYAKAQLAYKAALALDEDNAKATGGMGLAYIGLGAGSAALSELNRAIAYGPTEPSVYVDRGTYYTSIDDPGRALEDYETALSLDTTYARAYDAIGRLFYAAARYSDAIAQYDKALAAQPAYVAALEHRAAAWKALAAAQPAQSATYTQYAQNDLDKASALQQLVTTSSTATSSASSLWYLGSTSTTSETTSIPLVLDSGIR